MKKGGIALLSLLSVFVLVGCGANTNTPPTAGTTTPTDGSTVNPDNWTDTPSADNSDLSAFASCVTESWVKMYWTNWCSHCNDQKALFGDSFENIEFIDCDASKPACVAAGVQGFPTWIDASGTSYPGKQPLERLAEISGCQL